MFAGITTAEVNKRIRRTCLVSMSVPSSPWQWAGGRGFFLAQALEWEGARLTLKVGFDKRTWLNVQGDIHFSEDGSIDFELPSMTWIKVSITGGEPGEAFAWVVQYPH